MENFRYLRYIYAISKEKSFSKAAQKLYISQPALSAIIKKLETQLGYTLFDRQSVPLVPTEEGKAYLAAAEQILHIQNELEIYIDDLHMLNTGQITVAGTALYCSYVLPQIIRRYTLAYPGVQLNFEEADSLRLYDDLFHDRIDMIIDGGEADENHFAIHPLFFEQILLAIPIDSPINQALLEKRLTLQEITSSNSRSLRKESVDLTLLRDEPFVLLKKEHDIHKRAIALCRERDFTPKVSIHPNQLMTAYNIASQGLGSTFVTDTLIKRCPLNNSLAYYNVASIDQTLTSRKVFIAHKKKRYATRAMKNFIALAHKVFAAENSI